MPRCKKHDPYLTKQKRAPVFKEPFFISLPGFRVVYRPFMTLDIEGVGTVVIEHSARAKHLRITVSPGAVRVSVPKGIRLDEGREFALHHLAWIRSHAARMKRREKVQEDLLKNLPEIRDRDEAEKKIAERCRMLAREAGLPFSRLTIRSQKTRWGSCSTRNAISLNIKLARLPEKLLDYVILHELVHTRIKGHGPSFWRMLDAYVGDAKKLRRELGKYMLKLL